MTTPERQKARSTLIAAAKDIGGKLDLALRDPKADTISLTRAEASLIRGLIAGAAEALAIESSKLRDHSPSSTAPKAAG